MIIRPKGPRFASGWRSHPLAREETKAPKGRDYPARIIRKTYDQHRQIRLRFHNICIQRIAAVPQSLVKNYLHITFSTKHHEPLISIEIEKELHHYLAEVCIDHECYPIKIGGYDDHVHIVCSLSRKIALMSLIEHLKTSSSKWIKSKDPKLNHFYWQGGYYAVSVNPADLERLINYVENQREHHKAKTYKHEVISLLEKNDIPYDERYVWD